MHKARRFCSCLKSARWGHQFFYLAGTIFLSEFYSLIYKICTCYAMEYENILIIVLSQSGSLVTAGLFFFLSVSYTDKSASKYTYVHAMKYKIFNNCVKSCYVNSIDCYRCILIEFGMDSSDYFKPLDFHKIRRCISFFFFN